jgi:lysophospholipid acyltransferase (LPLAT)-like uncharacterized protein
MAMETLPSRKKRKPSGLKRAWRRVRDPLSNSPLVKSALANGLVAFMTLVRATNREAPGSTPTAEPFANAPFILALWHGQHLSTPPFFPRDRPLVALVSRSADAEMNAVVLEKFGIGTVRGSGGRIREKSVEKGGARALLALKKALEKGTNVCMIADIPHGEPRQAGDGIVALARISGRPIVCAALATSRRKVFERSWDKSTICLPFGRYALAVAEPIFVAEDTDASGLEQKRVEVTDTLNLTTRRAYAMVDGPQ